MENNQRLDYSVVGIRYIGLLVNIAFSYGPGFDHKYPLSWSFAALAVYSLIYLAFGRRCGLRNVNLWLTGIDAAIIATGVATTGGFESSTYLLFFGDSIIVAFYGRVLVAVGFGLLTTTLYYLTVAPDLTTPWHRWTFAYRACVLFLTTVGVGHLGMIIRRQWAQQMSRVEQDERTLEREQAISDVAKAVTSELDNRRVLELVLQSAVSILGASAGWVAMRGRDEKMRIVAVVSFPSDMVGSEAPIGAVDAGQVSAQGSAALPAMGFACAVTAPIEVAGEQTGMLALFSHEGRACGPEEHRLLRSLAELAAVSYTNAQLFAERSHKEKHLACLNAIGRRLVGTIDVASAFEDIRQELTSVLSADAFFVADYDDSKRTVNVLYMYDDGRAYPASSFPLNDGVAGQAITSGKIVHVNTHAEYEEIPGVTWLGNDLKRTRSILVVPMIREEKVVGALSVQSYMPGAYDSGQEQLVQTVANQVAVALENARLYEQMRKLSMQDWLTGLGNARFFYQSTDREIARAERYGHPLSLIMIDSDKLKLINDRYGHPAGDQHVIQLAEIIKSQTRQADIGIRYAGDEFVVVLPETDETSAMVMAERIRQSVEQSPLQIGKIKVPVTVSLGVAAYPRHGRTAEELFRNVDIALYQAKRAGKNHTSVYVEEVTGNGPMPVV